MLETMTVDEQYALAANDELRVLIVGAGMAGLTAAQLLRAEGRNPVLIERSADGAHEGYMLALMPMVDAALDELGVREEYNAHSTPLARYGMRSHTGRAVRVDSMTSFLAEYGDYRGIDRGALMDVLTAKGGGVTLGTTVAALDQTPDGVTVTLATDGQQAELEFDLVIAADGIHSDTRKLVLDENAVEVVDTGWGGWVVWIPTDSDGDLGEELWGAGFFLGSYPVLDRIGVFLGGAHADTAAGPDRFVAAVRRKLTTISPRVETALQTVANTTDPYYWPMADCRAPSWVHGKVVLVGDAAAGFMPTAGIGAGMAMESAWVLSRMLRYADRGTLDPILAAYEEAQRPRVEAAQKNSRTLAKLMFRQSRLLARLREVAMRLVSVDIALKPIQRLLQSPANPDAIAKSAVAKSDDARAHS